MTKFNKNWQKGFLVKGIQVCADKESPIFSKGDNIEIEKNTLSTLKIVFFQNTKSVAIKLG